MDIFIKIFIFFLTAPIIFLLVRYLLPSSRPARLVCIFFHGLILTILTVFFFNQPFWRWSDQVGFIRDFSHNRKNTEAYNYIWNHFILIDNSFDKELFPNPDGDEQDSTTIPITNRKRLTSFINLLTNNLTKIDLVVCDIGFDIETAYDSTLNQEFLKLYAENKLLLSINPTIKNNTKLNFNEDIYGTIKEEGNEKLYVSHTIKHNRIPNLKFPDKDAIAFADFLKTPNAGAVPEKNIVLLTNEKATRSNILRELVQIISRSTKEDLLIFYFSGHGKNDILENSGCLLSYDSENDNEAGTAISMDDLKSKIDRSPAKMKVSYIDACHAGLFKSTGKGTAVDNGEIVKAYMSGLTNASDGNVAFMASSARQQSLEDEKLEHGIFTYYLIKGLQGDADKEQKESDGYDNGVVTIGEMQTYLSNKIQGATKYKQKPSVDGIYDEDFPLSILRPNLNLTAEILKRPKKEKKAENQNNEIITYKVPSDEKLPTGMTYSGVWCYSICSFINNLKFPITLYGYQGFYPENTQIKISPGQSGTTPRIILQNSAHSIKDCTDFFYDCKFFFKFTENGVEKYATVTKTLQAGQKSYVLLNEANISFK